MVREQERRSEHIKEFGSFLFCPKRECLCVYQKENVDKGTECTQKPCILDDEEYIQLQKLQQRNRLNRAIKKARNRKNEEAPAEIRNQSKQNATYEQRMRDKIHSLEEESEKAFRNSNPNKGHTLFNRARMMRYELKAYLERKENNDDRR